MTAKTERTEGLTRHRVRVSVCAAPLIPSPASSHFLSENTAVLVLKYNFCQEQSVDALEKSVCVGAECSCAMELLAEQQSDRAARAAKRTFVSAKQICVTAQSADPQAKLAQPVTKSALTLELSTIVSAEPGLRHCQIV
jgi:hypothetical protein